MEYDAIIVGAGIIGLSTAYSLKRLGLRCVLVLDKSLVASGSTQWAAGVVGGVQQTVPSIRLALRTQQLLREVEQRSQGTLRWMHCGLLQLIWEPQRPYLDWLVPVLKEAGREVEILTPEAIAQRFPDICTEDVDAGLFSEGDGVIHPLGLCMTLAGLLWDDGVEFIEGAMVDRVAVQGGRVAGVEVGGRLIRSNLVLLAARTGTRSILKAMDMDIPIKPYRTQVSLIPLPVGLRLPDLTDMVQGFYGCPRSGNAYLIGYGTHADGVDDEHFKRTVDHEAEAMILPLLRARVPALAGIEPVGSWAGVCDAAPDLSPLMGPYGGIEGLHVGCGFGGYGLIRGMGAGEALADMMLGRPPGIDLKAFRAERFDPYAGEDFTITFGGPMKMSRRHLMSGQ